MACVIGVIIMPGETLLTRIPCSPHSSAICLHNMMSAALAELYAPVIRCGCTPDCEEMPTNAPWLAFKCTYPALASSQLARHVSANISSHASSDIDSSEVGSTAPAFDTIASSPLNCSAAASTKRSGVEVSRRSRSEEHRSELQS